MLNSQSCKIKTEITKDFHSKNLCFFAKNSQQIVRFVKISSVFING